MAKDDIMNIPIGSPILVKAWLADATETHALVRIVDEHCKARECWVKHADIVQPNEEWRKEVGTEVPCSEGGKEVRRG
jgi:hypothetical protein